MRSSVFRSLLVVLSGLSLGSGLFAQNQSQPELPSVGDLREEQRIINNAYLARGESFVAKAKEQIADNLLRPAKENGFYAVELLSRARKLLDKHPSRIEQARGIFGRVTESTREELRKNLREQIDPRFFGLQSKLEGLASILVGKGDSSLQQALDAAKVGDTARVEQLMRAQGITPKEGGTGSVGPAGGGAGAIPGIPGATVAQAGAGQVALNLPGIGAVNLPGTLSADGRYIDTPDFGRIDLSTGKVLPDGSVAFQSDKGLVIRGRDGKWHLVSGAELNPDGTATTADGKRVPAESLANAGGINPGSFNGRVPPGTVVIDQNGNRITIDADFENGEQTGVKKEYIGGAGATLVSETKVTRKLIQASGSEWRVNVAPGESRSWNFSIRMGDQKSSNGTVTLTLTVDGGGSTAFKIRSWEIADDKGNRASVTPSASNPAEAVATFTKGGEYSITVAGETDWASAFRVKGQGGVYP